MKRERGVFERVRGSGVWWIRYVDQGGRLHREKVGPKSAAIAAYQKRKTQIREARFFPAGLKRRGIGFAEIAKDALEHATGRTATGSYKRGPLDIILNWFGDRSAADVSPQEIEQKLVKLADEGRAPATLNRYRAALSVIYSLANRNGKISVNPARLVRLRRENNARIRFLNQRDEGEEARLRAKIREVCPEREPEFDLALHTGMRRGDQYWRTWNSVDLRRGVITIPRSKHGERRYVWINSVARAALASLWRQRDNSGLVCPLPRTLERHRKQPKNGYWQRWFEDAVQAANIPAFRWHDIRHTFASRLVMAGVDLRTVQELLGHKTITMTLRYAHLADPHQQEAIERLAKPLARGSTTPKTPVPTDTRTDTSVLPAVASSAGQSVQVQ